MRPFITSVFIAALALFAFLPQAQAGFETDIVITVKAKDAKFIGTGAGGAHVIIRNRKTGEIIADGMTYGSTGDTAKIMADSHGRDDVIRTEDSAKVQFTLEFWEPIPVTISATGPYGQQQSLVTVSQDMLLLPEKDYASGNGIMLEMPGFAVDVTSPLPNSKFKHDPNIPVTVEANVMKLCSCKIEEGSPWSPDRYQVEVHIYKENQFITSMPLPFAGEPGVYASNVRIPIPGTFRLMVSAFDPVTKEGGMDTTTVILEGEPEAPK